MDVEDQIEMLWEEIIEIRKRLKEVEIKNAMC